MPALVPRPLRAERLAGLAVLLFAHALVAGAATSSWLARPWRSDEGLPNNSVLSLAQTPDGFLWIGTPNGLARFDGVRFEEFAPATFVPEPHRGVLAMIRDHAGGLRLAMDRGAVVFLNAGVVRVFLPDHERPADRDLPNKALDALAEDGDGALWITYRNGAVCRIKAGKVTRFTDADGLPAGDTICSIACDDAGRVWFVKNGQFGQFRDGKFQALLQLDPAAARLAVSHSGGVWICSGFRLLKYREDGRLEDLGAFDPKRTGTQPSVLLEDRSGAVWIGTTFGGLFRFDGSQFESVPTTHPEILSLLEDTEGNVWAGTGGGGLNRIRPRAVELESTDSGLPFEAVQSLAEDVRGVLWAATQNGSLARRADGRWQSVPPNANANWLGDATCVTADARSNVWIGTREHRLLCWRDGAFVAWGDVDQIKGQTVHTLVVGRNGDLWLGEETPTAIQRLRDGKVEDFNLPPDIRVIRAATEDAAGNVWFGSSKGVLLRITGDRVHDETARTTGSPFSIRTLYATQDGSVWVGYAGWGVGRIKAGSFAMIGTKQGLFDDYVSLIVADGRGWLWFGANRGLFKVAQHELDDVADGRAARVRSIHYGRGEGLPGLQANFGAAPGACRTREGRLWLPMRTHLAIVDPERLPEISTPPAVLLTRVAIGDRTVARYGGVLPVTKEDGQEVLDLQQPNLALRLPPDHRRVAFEFTALSFVGPENVHFRYQLEGSGEGWVDAATQRSNVYPRLPAGDYRFRVTACNHFGVWNETGAALSFVVAPFFWQTWWFRFATLGGFTAAVIAMVRYVSFRRLRRRLLVLEQQAALHKERARIAKDIHDDLGANLTQISLLGELAEQDRGAPDKVVEHIRIISTTARCAVKSLDEIVWAVNPRNDTLAHFIDYTGQFAVDYLRVAGLRCRLDLPEQTPERELSTDMRHNLFLVVKEAINNTVKHAHATELRLSVSVTEERLQIAIEDNGRGFDQAPTDAGADGLRNMRQRAADIGGQCWVQGRPGAGAKVTVELPWERDVG